MRARVFCGVLLALAGLSAAASGQVSKPGMGTVTGHVICQDTQKPARFATVLLFGVPAAVTQPGKIDATDTKTIETFIKAQNDAMNSSTFVRTKAGFDGSFVVNDAAPGDYYLMVSAWGYLQPRDLLQAAYDAGEDVTRGISGVPYSARVSEQVDQY